MNFGFPQNFAELQQNVLDGFGYIDAKITIFSGILKNVRIEIQNIYFVIFGKICIEKYTII